MNTSSSSISSSAALSRVASADTGITGDRSGPALPERYGRFERDGAAFRVTDRHAPAPWVNVICNGRYGVTISHNGGGFSFFDDAQHCVLTRWDMDLVRDAAGKHLYLTDLDSGRIWSAAPAPCQPEYSRYDCLHEPGRTTFTTVFDGIRVTWTVAVAPRDAAEIWRVTIANESDRTRRLRVASYFEWCCGVAPDIKREFHKLFLTTRWDPRARALVATKNMWDIPPKGEKDHWNQPWPYAAAHALVGDLSNRFTIADKASFLGRYGQPHAPAAMRPDARPWSLGPDGVSGTGRFSDPVASVGGELSLPAGGAARLHGVLAIAPDDAGVLELIARFTPTHAADDAVEAAGRFWPTLLSPSSISSEKPDFDLLNNTWLRYQAISGRLWGRTGYYQQSGARGFRDQLQDSQVWLAIDPARTLEQILLHATRQFPDGSVNHWWHALADVGNHTACSDDYLWLPFMVSQYLKETGDTACLAREIPFLPPARDPARAAPGAAPDPAARAEPPTLLEHCRRSILRAFRRTSPRGLPFIGSCDWNDGLSALGVGERGESVWLGLFLCEILDDWAVIARRAGDGAFADLCATRRAAYAAAINAHAWDGAYYRGATRDDGRWIGASDCAEGRIHLNPQTWSILADVAPADRRLAAWQSVKQHLLKPYGPLLLHPAYATPDPEIGYITRYSPGSRENGGVYMHAATWALAAACAMKDQPAAAAIWNSISPALRAADADAYAAEPYVLPGNVDGPLSDTPGKAGWTWYTGSAAWLNRVAMEWVLGVRPVFTGTDEPGEGEALLIDPCPPAELGRVHVVRRWRGAEVHVRLDAREFQARTGPTVLVDGDESSAAPGGLIAASLAADAARAGRPIRVQVRWDTAAPAPEVKPRSVASIAHRRTTA